MNASLLINRAVHLLFRYPFPLSSSRLHLECPVWTQAKRIGLLFLTLFSQFIKHRLRRKMLYPRRM